VIEKDGKIYLILQAYTGFLGLMPCSRHEMAAFTSNLNNHSHNDNTKKPAATKKIDTVP